MNQSIPDLPDHLREVPEDRLEWFAWREQVLAFRVLVRREADRDDEFRAAMLACCARDYAFAMVVLGCLIEPRNVRDFTFNDDGELVPFVRRKGWYPWVPYGFQVEIIRVIQAALATEMDDTGKEDVFIEKSRDMGATWVLCFYAAMDWIFNNDILVGMYSHKEDLVDSDSPKSMFFKVRSLVGVNDKVPVKCYSPDTIFHDVPVRLPEYLMPSGFDPKKHNRKLNLIHPVKTNQIMGESTTGKSGIGDRTNYNVLDEVAKHKEFYNMWSNQSAVTDHRIGLTSADRRESDDAYLVAEQARAAARDRTVDGPRLISLPWHRHPLRDRDWERRMRARHANDEQGFAREYDIDWNAGLGDWVYPLAKTLFPEFCPYEPGKGKVYCAIDPGIRDDTAVVWIQYIPGEDRPYRVVDALILKTPSAAFLAPILLGFPRDHIERQRYADQSINDVMDFTWSLREAGVGVDYVGDPYGDNKSGSNSESFYEVLWSESSRLYTDYPDLNVPLQEILVLTKYEEKARYHQARKESLTKKLHQLQFHSHPRTKYVLNAIQNNRYKPQDERRIVQNEPQEPAHDWTSHPTTAMEFFAVNSTIHELIAEPVQKPSVPSRKVGGRRLPTPGYTRVN